MNNVKQKIGYLLLVLMFAATLAGCSDNNSPTVVSQSFWQAMAAGNLAAAKKLATAGSMDGVSVTDDREVTNLQFGDVSEEGGYTLVATEFDSVNSGSTVAMSFETVLEQEQGQWRVNFNRTIKSMLGSSFEQLQNALSESITEAGESIGEAVNEVMVDTVEEMSDVLQGAAEEMQKAADELRDSLQDEADETLNDKTDR